MSKTTLIVGLDGSEAGNRALAYAKAQAKLIGECKIALVFVIEWSPFSFQTPQENEERHKRREEELTMARERVMDPAVKETEAAGFEVKGIIRHGDVADILDDMAKEYQAEQIVVGRVGARGIKERLFGGVTGRLVAGSAVPVTIIP